MNISSFIFTRLIAIIFLLFTSYPFWLKIVIFMLFDILDAHILRLQTEDYNITNSFFYQKNDKIFDLISEYILFIYAWKYEYYNFLIYLIPLLLWRTIGVIRFIKTKRENILIYHPDFFIVLLFSLYLSKYYKFSNIQTTILVIITTLLNLGQEFALHKK